MHITINRLNHIQLCIPIGMENAARGFYTGILGLEEIEKPDALKPNGGLWYRIADIQLHIGTEPMEGVSKRHPAFEVENLAEVRAYLERNGVTTKDDIPIPGQNRFSFFDPFGNRIEFLERSGFEFVIHNA